MELSKINYNRHLHVTETYILSFHLTIINQQYTELRCPALLVSNLGLCDMQCRTT
ncbi:hypothetical protein JHK87_032458 [Glycine soja]|nr:hypothetical protein JHK87_032458 [Glycine soja]